MSHLILHIGHPKTGTTALQTVLSANKRQLLAAGVLYPTRTTPKSYNHLPALPYLTARESRALKRRTGLSGEELGALSHRYWRSLEEEVQASPHQTLVLSAESFWGVSRSRAPSFRDRLRSVCDTVKVVAYLRSPARRFLSQTNQNVRMFRAPTLPPALYFEPVIKAYRADGFEHMSLNVFESSSLLQGDVVTDFCAKYLPPTLPPLDRSTSEKGNESVSSEALVILGDLAAQQLSASPDTLARRRADVVEYLRAVDAELDGNLRPVLKAGIAEALVARSLDLPWLRDQCGVLFEDVDYDLVGTSGHVDLNGLHRVEDFCVIDSDRLAALRGRTKREIARIMGAEHTVRRLIRRLVGG